MFAFRGYENETFGIKLFCVLFLLFFNARKLFLFVRVTNQVQPFPLPLPKGLNSLIGSNSFRQNDRKRGFSSRGSKTHEASIGEPVLLKVACSCPCLRSLTQAVSLHSLLLTPWLLWLSHASLLPPWILLAPICTHKHTEDRPAFA